MNRKLTERIGKAIRKGKLDAELKLAAIADDLAAGRVPDSGLRDHLIRAIDLMLNSEAHPADALLAGLELTRKPGGTEKDFSTAAFWYWYLRAAGQTAGIAKDEIANRYGGRTRRAVENWIREHPEQKKDAIGRYEAWTGEKAKIG